MAFNFVVGSQILINLLAVNWMSIFLVGQLVHFIGLLGMHRGTIKSHQFGVAFQMDGSIFASFLWLHDLCQDWIGKAGRQPYFHMLCYMVHILKYELIFQST